MSFWVHIDTNNGIYGVKRYFRITHRVDDAHSREHAASVATQRVMAYTVGLEVSNITVEEA